MAIINKTDLATSGFDEDALASARTRDIVQNFALLNTSGSLADGIYGEADGIAATNFGNIETTGAGAAGIFIVGDEARVANLGTVATNGDLYDPDGIPGSGDEFTSDGIRVFGAGFQVKNIGEISAIGFAPGGIVGVGSDGIVTNLGQISVDGDFSAAIQTFGDSNSIRNAGDIEVESGLFGFGLLAVGAGNDVINSGKIHIDSDFVGFGMLVEGSGNQALNSGSISGSGLFVRGVFTENDSRLMNSGTIMVDGQGSLGVLVSGSGVEVINSGLIHAVGTEAVGISFGAAFLPGEDGRIENTGEIIAGTGATAVAIFGNATELINWGTISAPEFAVLAGDLSQSIGNYGDILGDVQLGSGDDHYLAGHGGRLDGVLSLGAGDDFVVIENGSGRTVIGDFQAGADTDDVIDISAFGFQDVTDLLAAAQQVGTDVIIALDRDVWLVLEDVALTDLDGDDFLFAFHSAAFDVDFAHTPDLFA